MTIKFWLWLRMESGNTWKTNKLWKLWVPSTGKERAKKLRKGWWVKPFKLGRKWVFRGMISPALLYFFTELLTYYFKIISKIFVCRQTIHFLRSFKLKPNWKGPKPISASSICRKTAQPKCRTTWSWLKYFQIHKSAKQQLIMIINEYYTQMNDNFAQLQSKYPSQQACEIVD